LANSSKCFGVDLRHFGDVRNGQAEECAIGKSLITQTTGMFVVPFLRVGRPSPSGRDDVLVYPLCVIGQVAHMIVRCEIASAVPPVRYVRDMEDPNARGNCGANS